MHEVVCGGKNRFGKEFDPCWCPVGEVGAGAGASAGAGAGRSGRSGKERTAGVAGSSASSPQVSRDGNKDQFLFWNETQLFVLLQPAGGSGSLDTSAST